MIKALKLNDNKMIKANYNLSREEKYICPVCKGEMILKLGTINIPHFSHKKNESCSYYEYSKSESKVKLNQKETLYNQLVNGICSNVINIDMEYITVNGLICDIYFESDNIRYGILIRDTKIELDEYLRINKLANDDSIVLIWIFDTKVINDKTMIPTGNFFRQLIFKKHLTYMIDKYGLLFKGMEDTKSDMANTFNSGNNINRYNGFNNKKIVMYYKYPLSDKVFRVDNAEYSFKVNDEWVSVRLGSLKVVK